MAPIDRARDPQATRAALLEAGRRRFTLLGYVRTTTRDIASDAGVNVSLISRYFGSKAGLLKAVLDESPTSIAPGGKDLVTQFVEGLVPDAPSALGQQNPLLLLLRDSGNDEQLAGLRRASLGIAVGRIQDRSRDATDPEPRTTDQLEQSRLRADLVLALFAGVALLREALPDEPVATAALSLLHAELDRVVAATLD